MWFEILATATIVVLVFSLVITSCICSDRGNLLNGYPVVLIEFDRLKLPDAAADKLPGIRDLQLIKQHYDGVCGELSFTIHYYPGHFMKVKVNTKSIKISVISYNGPIYTVYFASSKTNPLTRFTNYFCDYYVTKEIKVNDLNIFAYPRLAIKDAKICYFVDSNNYYSITKPVKDISAKDGYVIGKDCNDNNVIQSYPNILHNHILLLCKSQNNFVLAQTVKDKIDVSKLGILEQVK